MKNNSKISAVIAVTVAAVGCAGASDWPQWGGTIFKNIVSEEKGLPVSFFPTTKGAGGRSNPDTSTATVLWTARLGAKTFGNPVVAGGRAFVGTSFPVTDPKYDPYSERGAVMCFDEANGKLLWQLNIPRDEKNQNQVVSRGLRLGICSSPTVEGNRVYVLGYGADILCLDTEGQANGNEGPFLDEEAYISGEKNPVGVKSNEMAQVKRTASYWDTGRKLTSSDGDIVWRFSVAEQLEVYPHDVYGVSPLVYENLVYATTGRGSHQRGKRTAPEAPSLIALDKKTGELVAQDDEKIGSRVLHGQWVTPSIGMVNGRAQLLYGGGDGICYAFDPIPETGKGRKPGVFKKIWSFDPNAGYRDLPYMKNPKAPSEILSTPVCVGNRVYITIGQDWTHKPGRGVLACIDASKTGDITETGKVWLYNDLSHSVATVAVADGLVYATDVIGKVHCVDAETGKAVWVHDCQAPVWQSTLVADGKVYVGNSKGVFFVLAAGRERKVLHQTNFGTAMSGAPIAANGRLYVATYSTLYAIAERR